MTGVLTDLITCWLVFFVLAAGIDALARINRSEPLDFRAGLTWASYAATVGTAWILGLNLLAWIDPLLARLGIAASLVGVAWPAWRAWQTRRRGIGYPQAEVPVRQWTEDNL